MSICRVTIKLFNDIDSMMEAHSIFLILCIINEIFTSLKYGQNISKRNRVMDKLLQEIINWVSMTDEQIVIGISGHGAAGKTTFAKRLLNLLNQNEVNYINTDPYIVSSNIRKHAFIDYTYQNENHRYKMTACHPSAHHLPSLERDVQMVEMV
jgi:aspartokinase